MSLTEYKKKRDFEQTPEPQSSHPDEKAGPIFVVQRHQASQLHFDFRLEADGVLKSWAVPKGPSMNPADKRLAVLVEDHPLDYATFEGEIPEGNYGAGTVEIWDSGTWEPDQEYKDVLTALEKGLLEFSLHRKSLQGKFALIRLNQSNVKDGWLLIKQHDPYEVKEKYDAYQVKSKH
ncbi:MAG: 3'-phosphoesterase [Tannerellaceae bacterium]|nr:3'-phosphoesterase [Tannerellaceae bacterium]